MTTINEGTTVHPYLFFEGRCDEALEFYRQRLGAQVVFRMRYQESPDQGACANIPGDKVMHASFRIGQSTLMASDGRCEQKQAFQGFSLSLTVGTEAEADRYFNALADGGQVHVPLAKTFFSPRFGMVVDRFGVLWMVYVASENPPM